MGLLWCTAPLQIALQCAANEALIVICREIRLSQLAGVSINSIPAIPHSGPWGHLPTIIVNFSGSSTTILHGTRWWSMVLQNMFRILVSLNYMANCDLYRFEYFLKRCLVILDAMVADYWLCYVMIFYSLCCVFLSSWATTFLVVDTRQWQEKRILQIRSDSPRAASVMQIVCLDIQFMFRQCNFLALYQSGF